MFYYKILIIVINYFIVNNAQSQDLCKQTNCGSGQCVLTQNPTLPYYCRCLNGANTILPCPPENPCSRNPCGRGTCDLVPSLPKGYLCRCIGNTVSLTNCNATRSACSSNPCYNGVCVDGLDQFVCNCFPRWTGKLCDNKISSACGGSPCGLGKCFTLDETSIPFVCLCPDGRFGTTCNAYSTTTSPSTTTTTTPAANKCNPLESRACLNGGSCLFSSSIYRCVCAAGFTGSFCEININECASNPCLYGGICYDLQSSYVCFCPDQSFRAQCLPSSITTSTARSLSCPCENGGVCVFPNSQQCICPSSFTGQYCEHLIPSGGCHQISCMNGGTCYENSPGTSRAAYCLCKIGYTGKLCETEYFRCKSNGRFADVYNCVNGKYFECIHYLQAPTPISNGILLSRSCPSSLRYNFIIDRCDYAQNVQCLLA